MNDMSRALHNFLALCVVVRIVLRPPPLQVQLLNVSTGKRFCADLVGHRDHVTCAAFSPDSKLVVTGSLDGTLRLWCACCGECVQELQHAELEPTSVSFSPNGLQVGIAHRHTAPALPFCAFLAALAL